MILKSIFYIDKNRTIKQAGPGKDGLAGAGKICKLELN